MKYLIGLVLALVLVFSVAGTALATPILPVSEGQFLIFGEYNENWGGFEVGAGYGLTDNITLGLYYAPAMTELGGFIAIAFQPFVAELNVCVDLDGSSFVYGQASALYTFELGSFTLGLGGGVDFNSNGWFAGYVKAAADLALSDTVAIYGSICYWPSIDYIAYQAGLSLAF